MRVLGYEMMGLRVVLILAFVSIRIFDIEAQTNTQDAVALQSLTEDWENLPPNWSGQDPCGSQWDGISCTNSRITEITLANMDLKGQLTGDIASLSALRILDLSYNKRLTGPLPSSIGQLKALTNLILLGCGFNGRIPDSVGSLEQLVYLSLNENKFTGKIPASIGNLKHLYWLDLADNQLTGGIPVSNGSTPGLDLLVKTKHFHFGMNRLSGTIPAKLFNSSMILIHVLFDNNDLTGSIPSSLGLVSTLEAVRFDRNSLSGDLPASIGNLTNVNELVLSHNALTGPIPDLSRMQTLSLLDLSNNSFDAAEVPQWISSLQSLTTLMMEGAKLEGPLPEEIFSIPQLQTVNMRNNQINGTFEIGGNYSRELQLIDLQNNSIEAVTVVPQHNFTLTLVDNPFCQGDGGQFVYCRSEHDTGSRYTSPASCIVRTCPSEKTFSPACKCAYPFTGTLRFRAPSSFGNTDYFNALHKNLLDTLGKYRLPVESVALQDEGVDVFGYLNVKMQVFPLGQDYFNRTGIISIAFVFSNQTYKPLDTYGPYVFAADIYTHFDGKSGNNNHTGIIVGAAVGASVLLLLLICAGGYAFNQKKRAKKAKQQSDPFVSWDTHGAGGDVPQLKGARFFTFEELQKCTHNFSEANNIGSGGYGKVYKGILPDGQMIAIKRSQLGSMQGSREFKNEVELLSRVHHKNLVKLVGFCFDKGEQTLVYEFIPNGTLMESLSGKSGIQMDWIRRLMVTLGSARGLQYLHELADPPIIHRDIKSNNILLDERLTAKVADFGLSKLFGDTDQKGYVTTQVKGTMGYLDPEYFMTNQLTEKSDIFSFGVVMLEMVTARQPIQDGKYIVREVKEAMDRTKDLYNLHKVMDPLLLTNTTTLVGLEKFVDLALKCVQDEGTNRPTMGEVVKEIEHIVKLSGMNPNAESAPSSQTYDGVSGGNFGHPYSNNSLFHYSGSIPLTRAE
ncbi:probable leucine-rich repeat receptor-like protein kinase At5g49770 [Chenopodium quinoa]|uniref:probable leucine-rich repeat receptor-like protein kinase At5g49770 n=1 Tax=Chenopodium quinoa TaxID=63459 RepID=UPI000B78D017|nr:probable leucine-rich repeat receptor-like protein kinase At5g49770 [Chenopodium quinoa]